MLDQKLFAEIQRKHHAIWTSFSMDDWGLQFLLYEILNRQRNNVIEFGSGLSTIYIAEFINQLELNVKLTTVESDPYWLDKVCDHAELHNLSRYIDFVYAPVFPDHRMGGRNKWYSESILEPILPKDPLFDMVIVDGPIAYSPDIERSRYGAMPFMSSRITKDCTIVLDDSNRLGEQAVLALWEKEFNILFKLLENGRTAVGYNSYIKEPDR